MVLLAAFLLVLVACYARSLQKSLWRLPFHELKKRARSGTPAERAIYRVRSYGPEATVLLGSIGNLSASLALMLIILNIPGVAGFIVTAALLVVWFAILPTRAGDLPDTLLMPGSRVIESMIRPLQPLLRPLGKFSEKVFKMDEIMAIYDKHDLLAMLERQKDKSDSRVLHDELDIAQNALVYGERLIRDHMTPRRVVHAISSKDTIGPLLMDELHKSGHSRFPVYDAGNPEHIIGMLYLHDLVNLKDDKVVEQVMHKDIHYVQEDQGLDHALQAFIKTKRHLFIVINNFAEITGIITIEDVLEQVIGREIVDEFDQFDNLRAVAALQAKERTKYLSKKVVE